MAKLKSIKLTKLTIKLSNSNVKYYYNDNLKPIKLSIKHPDYDIKNYDTYCTSCSTYPIINNIKLELTHDEFMFLVNTPHKANKWTTQDVVIICNSLRDKGWKNPELYKINRKNRWCSYCEVCKYQSGVWSIIKCNELKFPKEPFKDIQYSILNINDIDYKLPTSIINAMDTVVGLYESCDDNNKKMTIPDYYMPYLAGAMDLLLHKKNKYNVAELSLLDFLGFPIELVRSGFIALDIIIPMDSTDHNELLLEYGFIVSSNGVEFSPKGCFLPPNFPESLDLDESAFCPLYMITQDVAELDKLEYNAYTDEDKDNENVEELLLLKYLMGKYIKYL